MLNLKAKSCKGELIHPTHFALKASSQIAKPYELHVHEQSYRSTLSSYALECTCYALECT
jgi:hypothetical protein